MVKKVLIPNSSGATSFLLVSTCFLAFLVTGDLPYPSQVVSIAHNQRMLTKSATSNLTLLILVPLSAVR